jgi:hypothetical protein
MPLSSATLESRLRDTFEHPGATTADCSAKWAAAIGTYFAAIAPPSSTQAAARAALQTQLAASFALPNAIPSMTTALTTYVVALGAGMAPAFVAVPPPVPFAWVALLAPPYPETGALAAKKIASALDTWARTGTATSSSGGAPIPWS